MTTATQINDNEREELLALYQVTTQDLAFFKSQQWAITNYVLVAFAAIVGIPQLAGSSVGSCARLLLCFAATVTAVLGFWVLFRLKRSIDERRARLDRIFARLSSEFQNARGTKVQVSSLEMFVFLCVLLAIGMVLTCWLVYAVVPS